MLKGAFDVLGRQKSRPISKREGKEGGNWKTLSREDVSTKGKKFQKTAQRGGALRRPRDEQWTVLGKASAALKKKSFRKQRLVIFCVKKPIRGAQRGKSPRESE